MLALTCACWASAATAGAGQAKAFPYTYYIDDLPNGLRIITIPTDYPNLVAYYAVVQAGSRNEVEPGKSGFAHLFEHLMFRGSKNFTPRQRDEIMQSAGVNGNAYTTDDRTVYHLVFAREDMDKMLELEGDRFQRLEYSRDVFKTETGAVLGEYNKNSANPVRKILEVLRETAFKKHTYSHTTMGYLRDIEDMPNQYDYSIEFYNRYYRPEYTTILMVGDITRAQSVAAIKKHFGEWKRGNYVAQIATEPPQAAPQKAHIEWATPTLPWVAVAYRGPAYSDTEKDLAALSVLGQMAFGSNSELYRKLVLNEQKVEALGGDVSFRIDPELFTVMARVKDAKDVDYVRDQILATVKQFSETLVPAGKLAATRSRMRYEFALSLDSSEAIALNVAPYVGLRRTPETINNLYALYDQVSPEDIRNAARKYFAESNRSIVTLATKAKAASTEGGQQ